MTSATGVSVLFYVSATAWTVCLLILAAIAVDEWRHWHRGRTITEWDAQRNARPTSSAVGFVELAAPSDVRAMYDQGQS